MQGPCIEFLSSKRPGCSIGVLLARQKVLMKALEAVRVSWGAPYTLSNL